MVAIRMINFRRSLLALAIVMAALLTPAFAQHRRNNQADNSGTAAQPWMDKSLSPEDRAEMVLKQLTLDEKMNLLHGNGMPGWGKKPRANAYLGNGGAGFVLGVPRLGIPIIQMSDAAYGVRSSAEN